MGLWRVLVDLFFPARCAGCGRVDHLLCPDCRQTITWLTAEPGDGKTPAIAPAGGDRQASHASTPMQLPGLDGVQAATRYDGVVRQAILGLKFSGRTDLAGPLADLMVTAWGSGLFPVDGLVPVPLHPRRLRERGYNQAALITQRLADSIALPVLDILVRSRMTEAQAKLGALERRRNVAGAFSSQTRTASGRSIMVVDDVWTTGSTLQACAEALRSAGAGRVFAMTVARADLDADMGTKGTAPDRIASFTFT